MEEGEEKGEGGKGSKGEENVGDTKEEVGEGAGAKRERSVYKDVLKRCPGYRGCMFHLEVS